MQGEHYEGNTARGTLRRKHCEGKNSAGARIGARRRFATEMLNKEDKYVDKILLQQLQSHCLARIEFRLHAGEHRTSGSIMIRGDFHPQREVIFAS